MVSFLVGRAFQLGIDSCLGALASPKTDIEGRAGEVLVIEWNLESKCHPYTRVVSFHRQLAPSPPPLHLESLGFGLI